MAIIHTIPRIPVILSDTLPGESFKYRGQGVVAVERSTGQSKLRLTLDKEHWITFNHGQANMFRSLVSQRPVDFNKEHHIYCSPTPGLQFRYECYTDQTKLTIVMDSQYKSNIFTYQAQLSPGLTYIRDNQVGLWRIMGPQGQEVAWHPPLDLMAGSFIGTANLDVVQEGDLATYWVTVPMDFWLQARALGVPIEIDPTTIDTSTSNVALQNGNQRKVDRCQDADKTLWMLFQNGSTTHEFWYSKDNGATWTQAAVGGTIISSANYAGFFIDLDDYAHVAYFSSANNKMFYRRGTPNVGRTEWTWSAATEINDLTSLGFVDLVAHREGTGWKVHFLYSRDVSAGNAYVLYNSATITSDQIITMGTNSTLYTVSTGAAHTYPSLDFHHTGDSKTVSGATPHLYATWSTGKTGASEGIVFRKATYSGGTWTWGTNRFIDTANYAYNGRISSIFDGTRCIVAYAKSSDTTVVEVKERNSGDTTTTTLTPTALVDGNVAGVSVTYDNEFNIRLFATGLTSADPKWIKYNRNTAAWDGAWTTIENVTMQSGSLNAKRGYSNNRLDAVYSEGAGSPYNMRFETINLSAPIGQKLQMII